MEAAYAAAYRSGRLRQVAGELSRAMESCSLCPRMCGVNRLRGEQGFCKSGRLPYVYSYLDHHGEEPPISGTRGSGTIFFSRCNLACVYCQNHAFSQEGAGTETTYERLAGIMLELQGRGCHNINLVTPTHVLHAVIEALLLAAEGGLRIPLVYNSGGYERPQIIGLLEGIVDVYLPDMRYGTSESAKAYSCAVDYPEYNRAAVAQMFRQVGLPVFDADEVMTKGLIIRHLVLPGDASGTDAVMEFIARDISTDAYISLMSQYHPYYMAAEYPAINRRISEREYKEAQSLMERRGLYNGWVQESGGLEKLAGIHIKPLRDEQKG